MNTAKRAIEAKKAQRSTSAAPSRTKLSTESASKAPTKERTLRSIGPVTRSLAAAARSAFSTATRQNSALRKANNSTTDISSDKCPAPAVRLNGVNRPPIAARPLTSNRQPVLTMRQSRPLQSQSFSQNLKTEKAAVKTNKLTKLSESKNNVKANEIAVSKDSVFSDEVDGEINWVIGSKYEFSSDVAIKSEKRKEPSYLQIAKVLNGYSSRRSTTPDPKMSATRSEICVAKSNGNASSCCTPVRNSPLATKPLSNGFSQVTSQSSSEVSDNGFCEELEDCSSYSFNVPQFSQNLVDGHAYRILVDDIFSLFTSHLKKCDVLLENQNLLPDSVSEIVRVVVGRTQLLMKKRLTQFNLQLERHLKPVDGEKITTLNDLHGLWSLVDIQVDDIRQCFEQVEESRLSGWKAVSEPKQTLTTAMSMPSLRMLVKPISNNSSTATLAAATNGQKVSVDETAAARKAVMEEKRKEETRRRQEFIRAKRLAMSNLNNNLENKTDNENENAVIGEQAVQIQT